MYLIIKENPEINLIEYAEMCNIIKKEITADIKKYNEDLVRSAIENKKGYKKAKQILMIGRKQIIALDDVNKRIKDKTAIFDHFRNFYHTLYRK